MQDLRVLLGVLARQVGDQVNRLPARRWRVVERGIGVAFREEMQRVRDVLPLASVRAVELNSVALVIDSEQVPADGAQRLAAVVGDPEPCAPELRADLRKREG